MTGGLFSSLMSDREEQQRAGRVTGLRFAEVADITDDGYVLQWLSGAVDTPSAPARAAAFMAGNERGAYFPFEIGDEVVVGFEEGHLDRPVILGALWSDQDLPPPDADTTSTNNTRTIVSRAGSELTFDDTQGATKVLLKSAGGMELLLDDSAKTLTIKFDDSTKIELSAAGVTVKGSTINLN
jgi:uncharacterized protein involved in type VI secretion and phage assembly